jgi:type IV pilus assembly protein PilV
MNSTDLGARQAGFTLIEILITLLIIPIGLLGLASVHAEMLVNQFESYQRAQALLLVQDMTSRIRSNSREARAGSYTTADDYGLVPQNCSDASVTSSGAVSIDLCEWSEQIRGASVTEAGKQLGSIINGRGCLENLPPLADGAAVIRVTVAWQGLSATVAPPSTCGSDEYGPDDRLRRVASVDVVLAKLGL